MGKDFGVIGADSAPPAPNSLRDNPELDAPSGPAQESSSEKTTRPVSWPTFLKSAKNEEVKERLTKEFAGILKAKRLDSYCVLAILEPEDSIDSYELDQVFRALSQQNGGRTKDVMLLLLSRGGSIEPAYQISKLCRSFAFKRFVAVVPRHAKSAATLIALGADEIHMGPLGQLGPIDPQIGGLPALGGKSSSEDSGIGCSGISRQRRDVLKLSAYRSDCGADWVL